MPRPLLGIAACFALGTGCGLAWSGAMPLLPALAACALGLYAFCELKIRSAATACLLFCVFFTAWSAAALRVHEPKALLLRNLMQKPREGIELAGVVISDPAVRTYVGGKTAQWQFTLQAERILRAGQWQAACGKVAVTLQTAPLNASPPRYGEEWQMFGVLTDSSRYPPPEKGRRRPFFMWVGSPAYFQGLAEDAARIAEGKGNRVMSAVYAMRRGGSHLLYIENHPEASALLQALLLGIRHDLPPRVRQAFMATGTFHVFAISGQHVMLVSIFLIFLLQAHGVSRARWFLPLVPALIFYTLITGMSASAMRGCIMALAFYAAPCFRRKPDSPTSLALAGILILAIDPTQLLNRGFILSFTAVAGLTLIFPKIMRLVVAKFQPDPFDITPTPKIVRLARTVALVIVQLMLASFSAWLATLPLAARWFNIVSLIGIIANLLVVPAISLILAIGLVTLAVGSITPVAATVFNLLNLRVISLTLQAVSAMAKIPGGHFYVSAPPWWFVAVWYLIVLLWLLPGAHFRNRLFLTLALAAIACSTWLCKRERCIVELWNPSTHPVLWARAPGCSLLVDTGPRFQANNLAGLLKKRGVNRISHVVFSRLVSSQAGGAPICLENFRPGSLFIPPGAYKNSPTAKAIETMAQAKRAPLIEFDSASGPQGCSDMNATCIYPRGGAEPRGETAQLILRIACANAVILLRPDASPAIEQALLQTPEELKADILVLLHPDAASACGPEFIKAVSPDYILVAGSPPASAATKPDAQTTTFWSGEGIRIHPRPCLRIERFNLKQ